VSKVAVIVFSSVLAVRLSEAKATHAAGLFVEGARVAFWYAIFVTPLHFSFGLYEAYTVDQAGVFAQLVNSIVALAGACFMGSWVGVALAVQSALYPDCVLR